MNFSRAKTILIIIFIFVNIFLLIDYDLFYGSQDKVDDKTALHILKNNNISVEDNDIKAFTNTLYGVEIDNLATNEEKLATLFLKKNYVKEKDNSYTNEKEKLSVIDLHIDYKVLFPKDKKYRDINILNAGNKVLKTLNKKGIGKSVLEVSNVSDSGNDNYFITLSYTYNDYPVYNNNLYATASKDGLLTLKGTIISFKELKNTKYSITPVTNILLELPSNQDLKNEFKEPIITDIRLGYYLPLGKTEASIYAIPAYEIEINNKKIYYYDARMDISSDVILLGSKNIM